MIDPLSSTRKLPPPAAIASTDCRVYTRLLVECNGWRTAWILVADRPQLTVFLGPNGRRSSRSICAVRAVQTRPFSRPARPQSHTARRLSVTRACAAGVPRRKTTIRLPSVVRSPEMPHSAASPARWRLAHPARMPLGPRARRKNSTQKRCTVMRGIERGPSRYRLAEEPMSCGFPSVFCFMVC